MTDDLTADELRTAAETLLRYLLGDDEDDAVELAHIWRLRTAADLMDQGWALRPPPQPGTVTLPADVVRALLPESQEDSHEAALVARRALAEVDRD